MLICFMQEVKKVLGLKDFFLITLETASPNPLEIKGSSDVYHVLNVSSQVTQEA